MEVVQLSDVHFTGAGGDLYGRDPEVTLELVLDDLRFRGHDPDVVVISGDFDHSKVESMTQEEIIASFRR